LSNFACDVFDMLMVYLDQGSQFFCLRATQAITQQFKSQTSCIRNCFRVCYILPKQQLFCKYFFQFWHCIFVAG